MTHKIFDRFSSCSETGRVRPVGPKDALYTALRNAWDEDPLATMKLLLQLGDPREGKSDRDNHQPPGRRNSKCYMVGKER